MWLRRPQAAQAAAEMSDEQLAMLVLAEEAGALEAPCKIVISYKQSLVTTLTSNVSVVTFEIVNHDPEAGSEGRGYACVV